MAKRIKSPTSLPPIEEIYESFELLYPQRRKDRERIKDIIVGKHVINAVPYSILDYILSPQVGKSAPTCRTIVVERRYYDRDHAKALSAFYAKSFRTVDKECIRLHFFRSRLSEVDLGNLEKQANFYLGFCVIRPFALRKIGRTVLAKLTSQPGLEFPTCHGNFEVNIGGSKLAIEGPAFMEQDAMVAACASVALWMSTTTLARRFALTECSTNEITERATQYLVQNRPMPSIGLHYDQMIHVLRTMGYEPILLGAIEQKEAKHSIYSYVESEIPPILLCRLATGEDHSIVVVGHGYQLPLEKLALTKVSWLDEPPLVFARSSEWVPYYLIHDDQRGLYRKLTFIEPNRSLLEACVRKAHPGIDVNNLGLDEWYCPVAIDMNMPNAEYLGGEEIANVWGIIVPLPPNVLLTSEEAERKSARLIRYWHWRNDLPIPDDLVLRTYLIPSNEYKRRIEDSKMDTFVKRLYRGKPMPRWIWVTEISSIDSFNSPEPSKWLIDGEVIIDATSNPWTPDFLAFHYIRDNMGIVATMKPEHRDAEQALQRRWFSPKDTRYPGWIR